MYKYKFQICELAHAQIEEKRGVPAGICRSCIHDPKVVARNTKIDQQIYLLMAGKGLTIVKVYSMQYLDLLLNAVHRFTTQCSTVFSL